MQDIIKRILEGNFDYENGSLDFSCAKIELELSRGSVYEGSFHITSTSDSYTNGYVTTSDIRMECLMSEFVGNDVEIPFCFHGENMEEGEVLKGTFSIVSNQGEYYLPFVVSIEHTVLTSTLGNVKNLFHFTNLAKMNWKEAVNLFYSPEFVRVFPANDVQMYESYRALAAYPGNEQNVEEFLIYINKKQKVEFLVAEKAVDMEIRAVENSYGVTETALDITRNGWGYTALHVECEGDFLFTEKAFLSDDDFLGNHCRLPVYIDSSMCRYGKNYGMIYVYNSYISVEIPVTVRLGEVDSGRNAERNRKRMIVQLMESYQSFRLKKISRSMWLKETGEVVMYLVSMDEEDVEARLFQAQQLITEERFNEAVWILNHAAELMERNRMRNSALWAYYLYLTTLLQREEDYIDGVAEEVEAIFKQNRREWRVAWLLLYLSDEYSKSAGAKWDFLEKQFEYGCSSPILYIEALNLLNSNPSVLRKLDGLGIQVIYYGARKDMLSTDLVEQLLYLTGRVKGYSFVLEKLLKKLYEKKADVRILQEICTLLIKGGKIGAPHFVWYERGVKAQLRITNLYEYYMMSADIYTLQEIPKIALMYFLYQNNLDYERTAFLYCYILRHQTEYDELYAQYRPKIEKFVVDQIQKGHINRHLAALYKDVLTPGIVTEQTAVPLSKMLFAHQVTVEDAGLRKVLVYQPGNEQPTAYNLQDKRACVVLYGNDNVIVFEDARKNRYMKSVEYSLEKLMVPGKYMHLLAHYVKESPALDIYMCEEERGENLSPDSVERYKRLVMSACASLNVKRKAYMSLLQYYYDTDNMRALEEHFERLSLKELTVEERADVIRYMVLSGKNQKVYDYLWQYGPYYVESKVLLRFADVMIRRMEFGADAVLLAVATYVFKEGKYNSVILEYLAKHYRGLTKDMRDIWKAAGNFDLSRYGLSERMLIQMLYSGAFVGEKTEIFRYYVSQGARPEVQEAFLAQCAYDFFVKEKLTEDYIFREIYNSYSRGEAVQWVAKLATLKYYAENHDQIPEEMRPLIKDFLREMFENRVYMNFFREYTEYPELLSQLNDKVIIEYRSQAGDRVKINYAILHENGSADEYMSRYMSEAYPGVYFIDFILFFGETLQYYIVEETTGEELLTESGSVQKGDSTEEPSGSKYDMINDMIICKSMQDYDTLEQLLNEYYCREYLNEKLFRLM